MNASNTPITHPSLTSTSVIVWAFVFFAVPGSGCADEVPLIPTAEGPAAGSVSVTSAPLPLSSQQPNVPKPAGAWVFTHPKTGEIIEKPPATDLEELTIQSPEAGTHSVEFRDRELIEVPSPVPNGGTMVNVPRELMRPLITIRNPDGSITVQHVPSHPSIPSQAGDSGPAVKSPMEK